VSAPPDGSGRDGAQLAYDEGDVYFKIVDSPVVGNTIQVTAPYANEGLYTGTVKEITWTRPVGAGSMVNIHMSGEVAMNQSNVPVPISETIIFNAPNTGSFKWKISEEHGLGWKNNTFTVAIEDTQTKLQGYSKPFMIKAAGVARDILVSDPRLGGQYYAGQKLRVAWDHNRSNSLRLTLLKKSDAGYGRFFFGEGLPWEGQTWLIPSDIVPGDDYYIRVAESPNITSGQIGAQRIGYSDVFSIKSNQTGSIRVIVPNGGEQWATGILNTVTWAPYQYSPDVNPARDVTAYLEQCPFGVAGGNEKYCSVVGKVQESGKASIHWITGELNSLTEGGKYAPPGQYYIRVVNSVTGASDRSDAPFTVLPRAIDLKVNGSDGPLTVQNTTDVATVSWTSTVPVSSCQLWGLKNQPSGSTVQPNGSVSGLVNFYAQSATVNIQCQTVNASGQMTQVGDWVNLTANVFPQAALKVLTPNGGETLDPHAALNTKFQYSGLSSYSLALYKNDQWLMWLAKDNSLSQGTDIQEHSWQTPGSAIPTLGTGDNAGAKFKMYVTGQKSDGTGYLEDKSDTPFAFTSAVKKLAFAQPGGAAAYQTGSLVPIQWNLSGFVNDNYTQIKLRLQTYNASGVYGDVAELGMLNAFALSYPYQINDATKGCASLGAQHCTKTVGEYIAEGKNTFIITGEIYNNSIFAGVREFSAPFTLTSVAEVKGPGSNAMRCSVASGAARTNGTLACYGVWDFGAEFGNDVDYCGAYNGIQIGCRINTPRCQSGQAVATRVVSTHTPWYAVGSVQATDADYTVIAANLLTTVPAVKQHLIRVWEYTCVATVSPGPGVEGGDGDGDGGGSYSGYGYGNGGVSNKVFSPFDSIWSIAPMRTFGY
jgi:hypothetical protein